MLLVLFLGHTAVAGENVTENLKETWGCHAISDIFEKKVLVRLTRIEVTDDDSGDVAFEFGSIFVAGSEYIAVFSVQGFDRRWDFGESPGDDAAGERAFVIHPDGTGLLYDFTTAEEGEEESPERIYNCVMEESNRPDAMAANAEAAYIFAIQQRINRTWVRPPSFTVGMKCVLNVRQLPGGEVVSVTLGSCDGDEAVKRSIEAAVFRASPLPTPADPSVFDRNLRLIFEPAE